MPIAQKLLEILVCPVTKQPLSLLSATRLAQVNALIDAGKIHAMDGAALTAHLQQALITRNGTTLYPVEDDIAVMLEARGIACEQLPDWQH